MEQVLCQTMLENVSSMLSKHICYAMMLRFPFFTLDTLFQHPEDSHKTVNSDHKEDSKEETYHFLSLGNAIMILIMKKTLKMKTHHFHSLGNESTPIGLLSIQMIFPKISLFSSLVWPRQLPRVGLQRL